jgi:hypothetical protein
VFEQYNSFSLKLGGSGVFRCQDFIFLWRHFDWTGIE